MWTYAFLLFYSALNSRIIGNNFKQLNFKCLLFYFPFKFYVQQYFEVWGEQIYSCIEGLEARYP